VRLAVGASRGQLIRQLLVESLLLALAGGALGVLLASWLTRALLAMVPAEGNPLLIQPEPDVRVLGFTLALSLLTGLVFGLLPALRASRPDLWTTLKDAVGSIASAGGSLYLRKGLVAAQVALSFLLLFGSGLFVRSLQNLRAAETGFAGLDNLVTFQISPARNGYDAARTMNFRSALLDELRALPGVRAAAHASVPLLHGWEWDSTMSVEGHQAKDGEDMSAFMNALSPGYFETMGVALLEGRDFRLGDYRENPVVAIVNQSFAKHFFGKNSALGRHIGYGGGPKTKLTMEIIGVVADSIYEGPREGIHRQVFVPDYGRTSTAYYVRSEIGSKAMYGQIRGAMRKLDASLPWWDLKTLAGQLDERLMTERLVALLSAAFGSLATLLAATGLYGVMAFVVARRTKELGLRMALGASQNMVIWLVMREVMTLLAIGLAIGVPAGLACGRYVAAQLYGLQPQDPVAAALALGLLAIVAAVAGFVPARRASRIDPILALRYE
jgi:predicted permease